MKLTKAQQALLDEVTNNGIARCVSTYKPAQKLIELDLVEVEINRYGYMALSPKAKGDEE